MVIFEWWWNGWIDGWDGRVCTGGKNCCLWLRLVRNAWCWCSKRSRRVLMMFMLQFERGETGTVKHRLLLFLRHRNFKTPTVMFGTKATEIVITLSHHWTSRKTWFRSPQAFTITQIQRNRHQSQKSWITCPVLDFPIRGFSQEQNCWLYVIFLEDRFMAEHNSLIWWIWTNHHSKLFIL